MTAQRPARRTAYGQVVTVARTGEALAVLAADPDTLAFVVRGHPRAVVMACPCGCPDPVVVPVDGAVSGAWRVRYKSERLTLMPSVWRKSGCGSHFILWKNEVHWCSPNEREDAAAWPELLRSTVRGWWRRNRRRRR
ncbi:DUF6527 family protein [Deinococcus sp.]|uniref:DUF6527 family protein n=1 Tax=Deinococcus sp. TaxID=47478 RepID=UPI0025FB9C07|nr:DUF6527 family protein [Deinococcus sp.]